MCVVDQWLRTIIALWSSWCGVVPVGHIGRPRLG